MLFNICFIHSIEYLQIKFWKTHADRKKCKKFFIPSAEFPGNVW